MSEADRVPANPEPELSQDEVARLRRLLRDMPAKQTEPQTACKILHEVGAELHGINARLDLMQKIFGGSALIATACLGFLFVRTMDISVSVGKIETRFVGVDERFDGVDKRLDGVDKRLDGIDKRLDALDGRFDGMDKRLDGIDKRLDTITSLLTPPNRIRRHSISLAHAQSWPHADRPATTIACISPQ
jgi:tetrahydromethanopterin S-methyltransferase subunit G